MRHATQDDASEGRRFGRGQSVWRRSFRRVGVLAIDCDCGVFFAGAAPEARSRMISPRRYGVGGLNSRSWKPVGGVSVGRLSVDYGRSYLGGVEQGLRSQVSVPLGHARLGMPKEVLDHVKRHALVHQETGERMAQIMQSDVSQARTAPDAVPWTEQTGELRGEDVEARRITRRRPQQCNGRSIERNGSRFARFRHWHEQGSLLPVHILPPGAGHLTAPGSSKQQEHDGLCGDLVLVHVDRADEALGLRGNLSWTPNLGPLAKV